MVNGNYKNLSSKKAIRSRCENYRGIISLLTAAHNIYSKIISKQVNKMAETKCTYLLINHEKIKEFNTRVETHLMFADYIKTFDRDNRYRLWPIL